MVWQGTRDQRQVNKASENRNAGVVESFPKLFRENEDRVKK
jgi:hypothetical protein